jgi:hypothetical protein
MSDTTTEPKPCAFRPSHLINRSEVRKFILDMFARSRPHLRFSRVSQEALDKLEYWLREKIRGEIHSHPSVGKTFKLL